MHSGKGMLVLQFKVASFSVGADDDQNDDAIAAAFWEETTLCLAIADGVGSSTFGAKAAQSAVTTCTQEGMGKDIPSIFELVHKELNRLGGEDPKSWNTTLTICLLDGDYVRAGHVGDTRLYHLRGAGLVTKTQDQTEVQKLVETGVLSRERAKTYPRKNILLSSMNPRGDYELQQVEFSLQQGDRILLVSDGLYRQVTKKELATISSHCPDLDEFALKVKEALFLKGLVDDASLLCAELNIAR